jgi:hypothetical protein
MQDQSSRGKQFFLLRHVRKSEVELLSKLKFWWCWWTESGRGGGIDVWVVHCTYLALQKRCLLFYGSSWPLSTDKLQYCKWAQFMRSTLLVPADKHYLTQIDYFYYPRFYFLYCYGLETVFNLILIYIWKLVILVRKLTLQKARRDMFCMTDIVGLFVILGESFIRMSSSLYTEIYKKNTDSAHPDHCPSPLDYFIVFPSTSNSRNVSLQVV